MSISPERGQIPYVSLAGSSEAGQMQDRLWHLDLGLDPQNDRATAGPMPAEDGQM
jgi:hypothetical protein